MTRFGHPLTSAKLLSSWWPPAYTGAAGCSSSGARLCTSLCQTLQRSCQLISPACQDPSGEQPDPLAYEPLLPNLCHQLNCCPIIQIINKGVKQDWTQYRSPGFACSYQSPPILCTTDHHPQRLSIHPLFNSPHCLPIQPLQQQPEAVLGGSVKGLIDGSLETRQTPLSPHLPGASLHCSRVSQALSYSEPC